MNVRVGTSGYSYKEWKGSFYPDRMPPTDMLRYYAERFPTVEINNTFYRMPSESTVARWAEEVPESFAFVLKASRRITHEKKLQDVADSLSFLFKTAAILGSKLGPFLFQLPPTLKKDLPRLEDFLGQLPKERRAAIEFRHPSWFDDEVYDMLRSHQAALCSADTDDAEEAAPLVPTAEWGYFRLRRADYGDADLAAWAERIRSQPWSEAFVFFKHEDEGKGPKLAARFAELISGG